VHTPHVPPVSGQSDGGYSNHTSNNGQNNGQSNGGSNTQGQAQPSGDANGGGESFDEGRNFQRRGRYRRFRHRNRNNQQDGGNAPTQGQGQEQAPRPQQQQQQQHQQQHQPRHQQNSHTNQNSHGNQNSGNFGRRNRRNRHQQHDAGPRGPVGPVIAEGETTGWFDIQRDVGYVRHARNSYLADPSDPLVPLALVRQYGLRRGDLLTVSYGRDQRNRVIAADVLSINNGDPALALRRPEFQSLIASYPDRKLTLETGKPAKGGPELTRRAIDLIAPIGYGQRALIVAPARAGKTMLLQAVIEGVAINHSQADLFVLLVDERPEEVSDMITLGYGEVIASSFDMPAARHTDVAEMTLERARRLVEMGRDVVIVLDSITRMARAYNTVERGTGRTMSGGLDSSAMAKPKAFFGSARAVAPEHGGGSLTIIATALVETGSRMDDVIFEEFKGTGNSEIKLDRSLAEKRIFPAIDIAISGTRREDKLFRPDQLEHVYTLRRGLQQMPSSSGMEWLIKRIASTTSNDALLAGL
jgi:transcription termination factor Rho